MSLFAELRARLLDEHGQPVARAFRAAAVTERNVDEFVGLLKGVLLDGAVTEHEARFVLQWLETNRATAQAWPASVIYQRLLRVFADNAMDADEEHELLTLLRDAIGDPRPQRDAPSAATRVPLTHPAPEVVFAGRRFCITGQLASGTRNWATEQIAARGGEVAGSITRKLHYLVIGELGSRDWKHSTHGTKILKAVQYVESGAPIAIVAEEHWYQSLRGTG